MMSHVGLVRKAIAKRNTVSLTLLISLARLLTYSLQCAFVVYSFYPNTLCEGHGQDKLGKVQ